MMRNKKGFYFIIDVVIGFTIIVIGLVFLLSYYYRIPLSTQPSFFTDDYVNILTTTSYGDVSSNLSRKWVESGFVAENDLMGESLAHFCATKNANSFFDLINITVINSIPPQYGFSVKVLYQNETPCLSYTSSDTQRINTSPHVSSSRSILLNMNGTYELEGPYILEVMTW